MNKNACARDIMTPNVYTVYDDANINFTEILAEAKSIRHIPILDKSEQVIGVVSTRAILAYLTSGARNKFIAVKELLSGPPVTAQPDQSVIELAKLMHSHHVGALPIVEGGKLVGMVSERDFLKLLL